MAAPNPYSQGQYQNQDGQPSSKESKQKKNASYQQQYKKWQRGHSKEPGRHTSKFEPVTSWISASSPESEIEQCLRVHNAGTLLLPSSRTPSISKIPEKSHFTNKKLPSTIRSPRLFPPKPEMGRPPRSPCSRMGGHVGSTWTIQARGRET